MDLELDRIAMRFQRVDALRAQGLDQIVFPPDLLVERDHRRVGGTQIVRQFGPLHLEQLQLLLCLLVVGNRSRVKERIGILFSARIRG